jgi:serine/threonine protein kinase
MIGQSIGHYKILDKLGAGGMGEVYRAEDTTLERQVALKILPAELASDPDRLVRFEREAKTLATLDHPNIVTIYTVESAGTSDGQTLHFLTMQLVEGRPLSELIPKGGLPLERIFEIAIPLADALAAAHDKGVIHRDLKPTNLMVTPEGRVKVLDFGLAKLRQEMAPTQATELPTEPLTQEGRVVGTVPYMSPEQLEGQDLDSRSDIFSLGVILYEMATGERPFQGDTSASVISAIMRDTPREMDTVREELPHHLGRVVGHCLEKNPERRYQSVKDVRNELDALQKELDSGIVPPSSAKVPTAQPPHRRRWWPLAAAIAVLLVALAVLWLGRLQGPAADEREITSLAVLPLRDLSGDPTQEYFAEGMTEALITDLSKISGLKVISRTSVMRYKETEKSMPEIARELTVDALIEGSVLRSGDQVRITTQLIDGRTDEHLWAESYTREFENILALHSEVARAIAEQIQVALTSEEQERLAFVRTVDPEAHRAYLKGRSLWQDYPAGLEPSIPFFMRSIELDPNYALAHAGLADSYLVLAHGDRHPGEAFPRAKEAALKALSIDDTLAEAHSALADSVFHYDWDWDESERGFLRALDLNPSYATAHWYYAGLLVALGRHEESSREIERAIELDPLASGLRIFSAGIYRWSRQYERALQAVEATRQEFGPICPGCYAVALADAERPIPDDLLDTLRHATANGQMNFGAILGLARATSGTEAEPATRQSVDAIAELYGRAYVSPYHIARAYAFLGAHSLALDWLEEAADVPDAAFVWLAVEPAFDPFRSDPRFQDLLRRMNFPD